MIKVETLNTAAMHRTPVKHSFSATLLFFTDERKLDIQSSSFPRPHFELPQGGTVELIPLAAI